VEEMEMLRKASHPKVIQVFEIFEDNNNYYIVTEYFAGKDFLDRVNE